jgi:hypothetical protein
MVTVSYTYVWSQCPTRMYGHRALHVCMVTVPYMCVWSQCPTRMYGHSALHVCMVTVPYTPWYIRWSARLISPVNLYPTNVENWASS